MANILQRQKRILQTIFWLNKRNIMTCSRQTNKVIEDLEQNPFYEKYAKKIATLQNVAPDEFLNRVEEKLHREKVNKENAKLKERQFSSILNPKPAAASTGTTQEKRLNDIMKLELVKDKTADEIATIWKQYHLAKDAISAVIKKPIYEIIRENIKKFPTFLFPLPRSQGYEFIVCQFSGNTAHFTPLLSYQVHKENAPECLKMVHFPDLEDEKGIVLMRGEFDVNVIDTKEAQCLANQLQLYYAQGDQKRLDLLNTFTHKPNSFKHMDLVAQLEHLSLDPTH